MNSPRVYLVLLTAFVLVLGPVPRIGAAEPLSGTGPLTLQGDIASRMIDGIDRFLLRKTGETLARRERHWQRDLSSAAAYRKSLEPNRKRLAHILGVRDTRIDQRAAAADPMGGLQGKVVHRTKATQAQRSIAIQAVSLPAFADVRVEGLLLPTTKPRVATVILIPDADQTPEQVVGLVEGPGQPRALIYRLVHEGCDLFVPALVSRNMQRRGVEGRRGANLTNREYVYRPAYEMGRHLVGYEVQKVLAVVDWCSAENSGEDPAIGLFGYGEGGLIALCAAALDDRIDAVCVSGYFDDRKNLWQEPIDRNVFGYLERFGDAELAAMIAPRPVIVEACRGPEVVLPSEGGAPGRLVTPSLEDVRREVDRARELVAGLDPPARIELMESGGGTGPCGTRETAAGLVELVTEGAAPVTRATGPAGFEGTDCEKPDPDARQARMIHELDRHTQQLLAESPYVRKEFMRDLDFSSLEAYEKSAAVYRDFFSREVIGRFDDPLLEPNPRTRKTYDEEKWTGYEVVLDVWPDVIAYGILLVPKGIEPGERRPVVVCQHGLEGRPQHVIGEEKSGAYKAFAAKLAEGGFVTFAPQNPYLFKDRFRTLQRKANPIGKTLFSIIVPQHRQIVDWLQTLPFVDPERIGFYGLSYGGKTAMRVPALVTDYKLSICSADFNDWVWKNASTRSPYSYVWTGEYEIFEFDLGSTFNYAEMAALICPRPFMVERGHFDGVAPDERVAYEYAKVRHLYAARLKIPERTEIEWFVGPHTIHAQGTFAFLRKHLEWGKRE